MNWFDQWFMEQSRKGVEWSTEKWCREAAVMALEEAINELKWGGKPECRLKVMIYELTEGNDKAQFRA